MKKLCFTQKQKRLYRLILLAENLEKKLSWVPSCKDSLEKLVEFFMEITPLEEYYNSSIEDLYFFSDRKRKLISNLKTFLINVGKSENGWNRTEEGKIPSTDSIFICVNIEVIETYEDENIQINDISLKNLLEKRLNLSKEELWKGQINTEKEIMNIIALEFLKNEYSFLRNSLKIFKIS